MAEQRTRVDSSPGLHRGTDASGDEIDGQRRSAPEIAGPEDTSDGEAIPVGVETAPGLESRIGGEHGVEACLRPVNVLPRGAVPNQPTVGLDTAGNRRVGLGGLARATFALAGYDNFPMHKRVRRIVVLVMLENRMHLGTDLDILTRVAEEVADHAGTVVVGKLHQYDDVRALLVERGMHRVPDALVAVDAPNQRHLVEREILAVAPMADPLRAPLPSTAVAAVLQDQALLGHGLPIRGVEAVRRGRGLRQAGVQVRIAHKVASEPKMDELTGVTMGPETTNETSTPSTWLGDVPRIWRTASMLSSRPCM